MSLKSKRRNGLAWALAFVAVALVGLGWSLGRMGADDEAGGSSFLSSPSLASPALPAEEAPAQAEVQAEAESAEPIAATQETDVSPATQPAEASPLEMAQAGAATQPTTQPTASTQPQQEGPASPDLNSMAFKDISIQEIAQFLSEKTGKPVIPHESIKEKKITIVSAQQMPLPEALMILYEALRQAGVIVEEHEKLINLRPIADAPWANLPIYGPDDPIDGEGDPLRIARKTFRIEHYDVVKVKDAILPMLPAFGSVVADPNTRTILVTDTVTGLRRIKEVIDTLDVPIASQTVNRIIPLEHADASWVAAVIRVIISGDDSQSGLGIVAASGGRRRSSRRSRSQRDDALGAEVVSIEHAAGPVLLVPEVTRNWLIAVAPASVMAQIADWAQRLDQPAEDDGEAFQLYDVKFADMGEIAQQINRVIESMPSLRTSVRVVPFVQSRKLLVFGSDQGQQLVRNVLAELDQEDAGNRITKVIALKYADAQTVAANIDELFSGRYVQARSWWGASYGRDQSGARVQVTADVQRNSLTIVTDANTMAKIERLIVEEWDKPIQIEEVKPRVYVLEYADPEEVQDLLESLFSRQSRSNPLAWIFGGYSSQTSPVGRLFGQFNFQALPDSNRLVVTTKNAANYEVIDQLITDLDQPQDAGLPMVVELKHAFAEDLAEQVNAILAEPGTFAEILRAHRDLSRSRDYGGVSAMINNESGNESSRQQQEEADPGSMRFWWQQSRVNRNERPTSNLVGKVRVVPIVRRNALLVLAPQAYREPILQIIEELDQPGSQVIIHAVIAEVEHEDLTTLGVRIASDPAVLQDAGLADQSIGGSANVDINQLFASPFEVGDDSFARGVFNAGINLNALIQLLIREFGLKVLFQPKLYTADNQEAEFFDGQDVSVQVGLQTTAEGTFNRSFVYVPIGTRLRIRPHVTQDGMVDLNINLELSRIAPGDTTFGNPIFDRRETTTNVVVRDGQTVMLSGIVRQEDFRDIRKLPLLGDLPLVGGAFRSTDTARRNRELIVFITPEVIANTPEATDEAMQPYREELERLTDDLKQSARPKEPSQVTGEDPAAEEDPNNTPQPEE